LDLTSPASYENKDTSDTQTLFMSHYFPGQEATGQVPKSGLGLQASGWLFQPSPMSPRRWTQSQLPKGTTSPVPVVHVALQGSWDESFHRYMSAGLTPCLRTLGLVLEGGQGGGHERAGHTLVGSWEHVFPSATLLL
jgi:hypothetical protein